MPLPILLAHRLTRGLADARRTGEAPWLRPDGKSQVSVAYESGRPVGVTAVVVSAQHEPDALETVRGWVRETLVPRVLGDWLGADTELILNPARAAELIRELDPSLRVGARPDPRYLVTEAARDPEVIAWAMERSRLT
jgi:hypothetical protein